MSIADLFARAGVVAARLEASRGEWIAALHRADGAIAITARPSPNEAISRAAEMLTEGSAAVVEPL